MIALSFAAWSASRMHTHVGMIALMCTWVIVFVYKHVMVWLCLCVYTHVWMIVLMLTYTCGNHSSCVQIHVWVWVQSKIQRNTYVHDGRYEYIHTCTWPCSCIRRNVGKIELVRTCTYGHDPTCVYIHLSEKLWYVYTYVWAWLHFFVNIRVGVKMLMCACTCGHDCMYLYEHVWTCSGLRCFSV